ncbi:hypothetical protein BH11PAT4_BH11PAT4_7820 [soil metagenome]
MELNFPENPPQPEVQPAYQDASQVPTPVVLAPEPAPLIPVLRKPRILVGRLIIFSITCAVLIGGAAYGIAQAYHSFNQRNTTTTSDPETSQRVTVATTLNSVPLLFSYDPNSEVTLPTKTRQELLINLKSRQLQSGGKDVPAVRVTIKDNTTNKSSEQLAFEHQRLLGNGKAVSMSISAVGQGLNSYVSREISGATTSFTALPNGKYMVIEKPNISDKDDMATVTRVHDLFGQTVSFD